ncbi:hypothetical protein K3495_g13991 [Podosphaera aphanis]|nr:hypothetical protein K3495_g13991 [Podosphaera aphanis]
MRQEYGNPWITNVFWGEDKHRFFKDRASRINHHNPERDLLDKERIHASIRGIVNEGFSYSCMEAAQQTDRLVKKYPQVFKSNLSVSDKQTDAQLAQSCVTVKLYEQFSKQQLHRHQIPDHITKWGSVDRGRFRRELRQFNIDRVDERREVFHWYKSCSYHTPYSTWSYSLGPESFIQYKHQLGKIIAFLNNRLTSKSDPIIFVCSRILVDTKRTDPILGFNIWEETVRTPIIPLFYVPNDPVFIIPLTTGALLNTGAAHGTSIISELEIIGHLATVDEWVNF